MDPEEHISFRREIPYPVNGSTRGAATIQALGLDREILNERRRDELTELEVLHKLVKMDARASADLRPLIAEAREILHRAVSDGGEFASMARAAIRSGFDPLG